MRERRLGPVLVLVLLVLALGGWLLLNSSVFAVRDIRVSGNRILSSAEVTQLSGVAVGDNLFRLSPGDVNQALRRSPWIAGVEVERRWPSTLVVRVRERSPVGWAEDGDGTRLLVAGDGTVLQAAVERPTHLPALGGVGWELAPGAAWEVPRWQSRWRPRSRRPCAAAWPESGWGRRESFSGSVWGQRALRTAVRPRRQERRPALHPPPHRPADRLRGLGWPRPLRSCPPPRVDTSGTVV